MHDPRRHPGGGGHYPGYDVRSKWSGPSWNEKTREVIRRRLAIAPEPRFFTAEEFETVSAVAARIVPQPTTRPPIPVAALVDRKLDEGTMDGYRVPGMPRDREAWRVGLRALDAEAQSAYRQRFATLTPERQDALLQRAEAGELSASEWGTLRPEDLRLARDIVLAYYAHPTAWSEIGFGGPASPRGYVRLGCNERDPWEAAEASSDDDAVARWRNRHVG
jgi:hypothetical protein